MVLPEIQTDQTRFDWDNLKYFLALVRAGSFRTASEKTRTGQATLRRRLKILEEFLGVRLINRSYGGIVPTDLGRILFGHGEEVERAIFKMTSAARLKPDGVSGDVSIHAPEMILNNWLLPFLSEFGTNHPNLTIELSSKTAHEQSPVWEKDLWIAYHPSSLPDVIQKRIGKVHFLVVASEKYRNKTGLPETPDDLCNHPIGFCTTSPVGEKTLREQLQLREIQPAFRVDSSSAYIDLIRRGSVLGLLPSYVADVEEAIIPVDGLDHCQADLYMNYHPSLRDHSAGALVIDFIKSCFVPTVHQYFRDELVMPLPA